MARVIRWIFLGIKFITPYIFRVIGFMFKLAATSLASVWVGVPTSIRRIADLWVDRAVKAGFPTEYDTYLYHVVAVVAFLFIVAGWLVLAYGTVYLIHVIF